MPDINVRFRVLDSFRGLCAIFVVLYHLKVIGAFSEWSFFRNSGIFVEFFFILSGFVLTHGYAFKSNLSFKNFISSRVFRLFPLHVLVLFAFIVLELGKWLISSQINVTLNNAAFTGDYSPKFILPNLLLIHAWFESFNPLSFNTLSWS
ncbi:MAG: acyltransferase, partial [Gammaproteobacteria bacterium]